MCGRFAFFSLTPEELGTFGICGVDFTPEPRYNIAPTQVVPVIVDRGERKMELLRWGLIPAWARDEKIGNRLINARAETLLQKPGFRDAYRKRRCLVPADGFYEWKKTPEGKLPHFVRMKSRRPFGMAGLWETWSKGGGDEIRTFTIITTEPNDVVGEVHDRMPAIVAAAYYDSWLAGESTGPEELQGALGPFEAEEMETIAVSARVNSPANDDASIIEPS